jgi:GNAT superfamily N-acetyltransferase
MACEDVTVTLRVRSASLDDPAVVALVGQLMAELDERYADVAVTLAFPSAPLDPSDLQPPDGAFVVGEDERMGPIACGGFRRLGDGVAEIKRMFVAPHARGSGAGAAVLSALEAAAIGSGYRAFRLETGVRQPDAISLYERAGYRRIERYGEFVGSEFSVCFEKTLAPHGEPPPDPDQVLGPLTES